MEDSEGKTISGLAYSAEKRQLFWLNIKKYAVQFWDFRTRRLETMDLDKSSLIRFSGSANPVLSSLAVHGDNLYVSAGGNLLRSKIELDTTLQLVRIHLL